MSKKLRCDCGKWVARLGDDGEIYVWCKNCKKEVKLPKFISTETQKSK